MYLKSNLSYLRTTQGVTQEALGKEFGLSKQIICLYETGLREPTIENLIKIARFFEVSIDNLLTKDLRPAGSILSGNIKYLRKSMGYTQTDMCRLLKISQPALANYENGARIPSIEGLLNISEFFGVTVDDLLKKDLSKEG